MSARRRLTSSSCDAGTQQLAPDRRGHLAVVVAADKGEHRVPLLGRGGDGRHLADAGDRHLQGARDRGGRHRQHVHRGAQVLERLLVPTPKRCSLSTTTSPRSLNRTCGNSSRWVRSTTSTLPSASPSRIRLAARVGPEAALLRAGDHRDLVSVGERRGPLHPASSAPAPRPARPPERPRRAAQRACRASAVADRHTSRSIGTVRCITRAAGTRGLRPARCAGSSARSGRRRAGRAPRSRRPTARAGRSDVCGGPAAGPLHGRRRAARPGRRG